jgi:hypothetical protein
MVSSGTSICTVDWKRSVSVFIILSLLPGGASFAGTKAGGFPVLKGSTDSTTHIVRALKQVKLKLHH